MISVLPGDQKGRMPKPLGLPQRQKMVSFCKMEEICILDGIKKPLAHFPFLPEESTEIIKQQFMIDSALLTGMLIIKRALKAVP